MVFAILLMVLKRTRLGLDIRAVAQNRAMARAMGIRSEWVDAMTFGLGSGIAGVAGVALSQLTNVGPNLGQSYIIDSFMVVVFGGVGNLWGTLIGGMSMGIVNKLLEPYAGAVLAKIVRRSVALILFIQSRARGGCSRRPVAPRKASVTRARASVSGSCGRALRREPVAHASTVRQPRPRPPARPATSRRRRQSGRTTFSATRRPPGVDARYTRPMPPARAGHEGGNRRSRRDRHWSEAP